MDVVTAVKKNNNNKKQLYFYLHHHNTKVKDKKYKATCTFKFTKESVNNSQTTTAKTFCMFEKDKKRRGSVEMTMA